MLTKDLVRASVVRGYLKPQFVDTTQAGLLALAEQLLTLYEQERPTRGEIDDAVSPLVNAQSDVRLAKGLNKLLQDRSDFSHACDLDYHRLRRELFTAGAAKLTSPGELEYEAYAEDVLASLSLPPEFVERGIYADLPENEELIRFRSLSAEQLLQRYNVALVQALLLRADKLELIVESPEPARMRRLFKYLKFFRLLGRLFRHDEKENTIRLDVDGPASILEQSRKYGMQLASFFPAVCSLDKWQLKTTVEWKDRRRELRLGDAQGLVSHYRNFSAYVPEEIRLFHGYFQGSVEHWAIVGETPFLDGGNQELIFPDLSFRHESGGVLHLELFHRWHAGQLQARLEYGEAHPQIPLIIGVDRFLTNDPGMAAQLESSPWFQSHGFLFRDYPTANRVVATLDSVLSTARSPGTPLA